MNMMHTLQPVLDINAALALKASALEWLDSKALTIDASPVERITTPCIQIILALMHARDAAKRPTEFQAPSQSFMSAFQCLGLAQYLQGRVVNG